MKVKFSDVFLPTGRQENPTHKTVSFNMRDVFLPKIVRSDPKVRIAAIPREKNIELLKNVAKNDSDPEVRRSALKRLQKLTSYCDTLNSRGHGSAPK
jgi:hypothetical protein